MRAIWQPDLNAYQLLFALFRICMYDGVCRNRKHEHAVVSCRRAGANGARPRGVWEIMDSLRDISPDDLFPGVAYSISEDDGDEDMPYTRPMRPTPKDAQKDGQRDGQDGSDRRRPEGITHARARAHGTAAQALLALAAWKRFCSGETM